MTSIFLEPSFASIDELAYRASRPENYGDCNSWFLNWRLSLNGVRSRSAGFQETYLRLTEWLPYVPLSNPENDVAVALFCMDSAIESWAFALNSFGYGLLPDQFKDLGCDKELKNISPENIFGSRKRRCRGYDLVFPRLAELWRSNESLIRIIINNHDVAKHRHANLFAYSSRTDPPVGMLESLGIDSLRHLGPFRTPLSSITLARNPKISLENRPKDVAGSVDLIQLKPDLDKILELTPILAFEDAQEFVSSR